MYTAASGWTESTLTWSTRPPRVGSGIADKGSVASQTWIEFDVTPLVTGDATYTFVLAQTSSDGVDLSSRESTQKPELVVVSG